MYLIVFTRRRLAPLVRKIPSLLPIAAIFLPVCLAASLTWLQFESSALRQRISDLAGQVSGYERQLEAEQELTPTPYPARGTSHIIVLRSPAAADSLSASVTAVPEPEAGGVFAVQLASLHSRDEARRVADGLKAGIPRPLIIQRAVLNSGQWYRVLIQPFQDRKEAATFADSLRGGGTIRDYVLQRLPVGWRDDPDYVQVLN